MAEYHEITELVECLLGAVFGRFYAAGHAGFVEVRIIGPADAQARFFPGVEQVLDALPGLAYMNSQRREIYLGVNPRAHKRGREEDVNWVVALHADWDAKESGLLDPAELSKRTGIAPSIIVASGHGLHPYWLLREPLNVTAPEARAAVRGINAALAGALGADHCHDLSRVLRLPGFINWKRANQPVAVELGPCRAEVLYTLEDFYFLHPTPIPSATAAIPQAKISSKLPQLSERVKCLLETRAEFRGRWNGNIEGLSDDTRSGRDWSLTLMMIIAEVPDDEIAGALELAPHNTGKKLTRHYLERTLLKAHECLAEQKRDSVASAPRTAPNANAPAPAHEWKPQPGAQAHSVSPWLAESMAEFLADDGVEHAALYEPLLYPETVTEIFSPRGIGKSVFALHVAIVLAQKGKRVLYIDRDNPRRVIRERLRAWGADEELASLKVIAREKCPPLTRADLWARFPYDDHDVVILDSFDSIAEGVGEQDSAKPSRAIAPVLDIAHRQKGPAVLVLGNCVRSAKHSRGSGVVEDRADVVFEVRDATDFHPTGSKPWVEELPAQGADDWASRSSRRKLRENFRLAFICTKFRLGEEPAPFILEIGTVSAPWHLRDVTDEVDREGVEAREHRVRAKADAIRAAVETLQGEIVRQVGVADILKTQAEYFLTQRGFKRKVAREAIASPVFEVAKLDGKGRPRVVRLAGKNQSPGRNEAIAEPAKTLAKNDAHFCRPHEQSTAEISRQETQYLCGFQEGGISAADSIFRPPDVPGKPESREQEMQASGCSKGDRKFSEGPISVVGSKLTPDNGKGQEGFEEGEL